MTNSLTLGMIAFMAKVTGKFQVTLPKNAVDQCGIQIGDTLVVRVSGGAMQITRSAADDPGHHVRDRLLHFDRATRRQRNRAALPRGAAREWTREELYHRGRAR